MPYFIFVILSVVTIVFVWKFIPETKGKTLEEMERMWDKKWQMMCIARITQTIVF